MTPGERKLLIAIGEAVRDLIEDSMVTDDDEKRASRKVRLEDLDDGIDLCEAEIDADRAPTSDRV